MKKQLLFSIALCCISALLLTSCKDKSKETVYPKPTTYDLLLGTWLATHDAVDDNNNSIIEESEKLTLSNNEERFLFTFRSDGTFVNRFEDLKDPSNNDEFTSTWSLINDDKEILLIDSDTGFTDTTRVIIMSLNSKQLILVARDDQFSDEWVFFERN